VIGDRRVRGADLHHPAEPVAAARIGEDVVELRARRRARERRRRPELLPAGHHADRDRGHVQIAEQHPRAGQRPQMAYGVAQLPQIPARHERQVRGGDGQRPERGLQDGREQHPGLVLEQPEPVVAGVDRGPDRGAGQRGDLPAGHRVAADQGDPVQRVYVVVVRAPRLPALPRRAGDRRGEPVGGRPHRLRGDLGEVEQAAARLGAVDLLQAEHVGVQVGDGGAHPVGVYRAVGQRPAVQQVEGRQSHEYRP